MKRSILLLALAGALALAGCVLPTHPGHTRITPPQVQRLLDDTALYRQQAPDWKSFGEYGATVTLFWVRYGQAMDCPSGCFYHVGYGLLIGDEARWFTFDPIDGSDHDREGNFAFTEVNRGYFTGTVLRGIEETQSAFYRGRFLPLVAQSPVAGAPLLGLAINSLFTYIDPYLAGLLIQNPAVRADRELLFTLAGLPHFQGDAYAAVRAEARRLLGVNLAG